MILNKIQYNDKYDNKTKVSSIKIRHERKKPFKSVLDVENINCN